MLAYQWCANTGTPVVFLHGLLGSMHDWASLLAQLQNVATIRPLVIDLPFHGASSDCSCHDFVDMREQLHLTFETLLTEPFWLVGYSLGGRLALDYWFNMRNSQLKGVIVEGANIGQQTATEREARWQHDLAWAQRFRHEPLVAVLTDWYQQPVFAHLNTVARMQLIETRQQNSGEAIANMLEATSLAKQADFSQQDWTNVSFLIGEYDNKFRKMAENYQLPHALIAQAGHNAHRENPYAFAQTLLNLLNKESYGTPPLS